MLLGRRLESVLCIALPLDIAMLAKAGIVLRVIEAQIQAGYLKDFGSGAKGDMAFSQGRGTCVNRRGACIETVIGAHGGRLMACKGKGVCLVFWIDTSLEKLMSLTVSAVVVSVATLLYLQLQPCMNYEHKKGLRGNHSTLG